MKTIAKLSKRTCRLIFAASVLACFFLSTAHAEDRRNKVEAAYLYSFFNYITWPGYVSPQALLKPTVCVYGNDPITGYLDYIRQKMSEERILTVKTVAEGETPVGCHILFIRHRISQRMLGNIGKDTLVVFKPDDPLDRGGMIELAQDGERIAIRINQNQLEQNGFQISSRLLDLAQAVR